jgi:hypothetical protein
VFLDDPIEGVRVIRSSNGIYQADRKYFCWQPSFYGGSSGAADDDRETVSVRGVQKVHLRVKCTDPRNPPANLLDLAQKEALNLLKTSAVNGATSLAPGNQSPALAEPCPGRACRGPVCRGPVCCGGARHGAARPSS